MKYVNTLLITIFSFLLAGCADHLYFGTATSAGLDVDGTSSVPDHVSFAYDRGEMAIVPPKDDGNAHSVMGMVDSEFTWTEGMVMEQVFATGNAAIIASSQGTESPSESQSTKSNNNTQQSNGTTSQNEDEEASVSKRPLYFITGTKIGLDISVAQAEQPKASLLLGYKRAETTVIPIRDSSKEVNSVYADISMVSKTEDWNSDNTENSIEVSGDSISELAEQQRIPRLPNGIRIKQSFGTGKAAEYLAKDPKIQQRLFDVVAPAEGVSQLVEIDKITKTLEGWSSPRIQKFADYADGLFPSKADSNGKTMAVLVSESQTSEGKADVVYDYLESMAGDPHEKEKLAVLVDYINKN